MDRELFLKTYSQIGRDLSSFAESLLEDPSDADDAVQEAARAILQGDPPLGNHERPYFFKAVRNACFRILRSSERRKRLGRSWVEFRRSAEEPDNAEIRTVRFAVAQLPPDIRDVVVLHYWNKLTLEEVSEVLAIPKTTAEYRHKQARDLLRGTLRIEKGEQS